MRKCALMFKVSLAVAATAALTAFGGPNARDAIIAAACDFKPLAEVMATNPAAVLSPQISSIDARAFKVACGESGEARVFAF